MTGVTVQGHNGSTLLPDSDVNTFIIQYSLEGLLFFNYKINDTADTKVVVYMYTYTYSR